MADLRKLAENLIAGNAPEVQKLTQQAIDDKISPADILEKGLIAGMDVVGRKFKNNEFYFSCLYRRLRAFFMQEGCRGSS